MSKTRQNSEHGKVYFIGSPKDVEHFVTPLRGCQEIEICEPKVAIAKAGPGDLCVVYNEFYAPFRECCIEVKKRGCGTLYAIDGILEWRNLWEFPPSSGSCLWTMRPILSDKVACIGQSQARILESFGNTGKCEVVGVPRFDKLAGRTPRKRDIAEFRLLIMTAKTPAYTSQQLIHVRKSLLDLKCWIEKWNSLGRLRIRPQWRLTAELGEEIGVTAELRDTTGNDLASVLMDVDALISTPSTGVLEGMLQGIPVAILDYTNSPQYVPAAWSITAPEHLDMAVPELIEFPEKRRLLQDSLLHDHLECRTPSVPRMSSLIEQMLAIGRRCCESAAPLHFPSALLPTDPEFKTARVPAIDMSALFPGAPAFKEQELSVLQAETAFLRLELRRLSDQVAFISTLQQRLSRIPLLSRFLSSLQPLLKRMMRLSSSTD